MFIYISKCILDMELEYNQPVYLFYILTMDDYINMC